MIASVLIKQHPVHLHSLPLLPSLDSSLVRGPLLAYKPTGGPTGEAMGNTDSSDGTRTLGEERGAVATVAAVSGASGIGGAVEGGEYGGVLWGSCSVPVPYRLWCIPIEATHKTWWNVLFTRFRLPTSPGVGGE